MMGTGRYRQRKEGLMKRHDESPEGDGTPPGQGLQAKLERHFGFKRFRAGQAEAVNAAIAGRDALVVMPTGSGKSLCYQLPALELEGPTLVVSPLIALMKDQADGLRGR